MNLLRSLFEEGGLHCGRWVRLPLSRRFIVDYLHFARQIPSQPLVRICNVERIAELRENLDVKIGWAAIVMKAYSAMASNEPELRSFFMKWPWMHLYQHSHQVGRLAITRDFKGENWLFFIRLERPEEKSLAELQAIIDSAQDQPLESIPLFRLQRCFSFLPTLVRRLVWWFVMNVSGGLKTGLVGTFGITSVAAFGAISVSPPSLGSMLISYGPVSDDGELRVTFVYDHRVYDGAAVARFLSEFESVLNNQVASELAAYCSH